MEPEACCRALRNRLQGSVIQDEEVRHRLDLAKSPGFAARPLILPHASQEAFRSKSDPLALVLRFLDALFRGESGRSVGAKLIGNRAPVIVRSLLPAFAQVALLSPP